MDEQLGQRDAIDVDDFVYAATGARIRRLTMPDGTHWFPAADVAGALGYADTRGALSSTVPPQHTASLADLVRTAASATSAVPAGPEGRTDAARESAAAQGLGRSARMVNLQGLVQLVNGCAEPSVAPFKAWVGDLVAALQRDGCYALDPSPAHPGYVMPQEMVDIIVRLEERNLRLGAEFAAHDAEQEAEQDAEQEAEDGAGRPPKHETERDELLREARRVQRATARALSRLTESLERRPFPAQRTRPPMTPEELLDAWHTDRLPVTGDVHAVASYLAPALVRGGARYRLEDIARRTGLAVERVRAGVELLVERGCVRQAGASADGALIFVLPE
ncbi:Bro-N domain-containing protein [Streptomyces sp. NPDC053755]|uniref:BRO-N domain-containing protein n=1 Tax=Streptomyces sp. NPDC053755 TaxID=3155815 RepID=UPI003438324C